MARYDNPVGPRILGLAAAFVMTLVVGGSLAALFTPEVSLHEAAARDGATAVAIVPDRIEVTARRTADVAADHGRTTPVTWTRG